MVKTCCENPALLFHTDVQDGTDAFVRCSACGQTRTLARWAHEAIGMLVVKNSTNISGIGYERAREILRVDFSNGGRYVYFDVPQVEWDLFQHPEGGYGRHFAARIRGKFRSIKLVQLQAAP